MAMRTDATRPTGATAPKRTSFASMYQKPQSLPVTLGGQQVGTKTAPMNPMVARGTGVGNPAPPAPAPVTRAPSARVGAAPAPSVGGGYSAGQSLGVNAQGQAAAVAQPAQPMSDEDWWNSDADYQVENAGLQNVLQTALANLATKRANYDTDFVGTLKNLGWDWEGDDAGSLDAVDRGKWDAGNKLGAYGSGLNGLNNDFAGRGLMDSSFYGDSLTNFNTDFNNQFGNLTKQRGSFLQENGENTGQGLAARNEYQNALARARQGSLARRDIAV